MRPIILFNFIALAAATPVLVSDAVEQRTMDQIYQAALKERVPLRVAWSGEGEVNRADAGPILIAHLAKETTDSVIKAFNKEYPGIIIHPVVDESKYLDSAIDRTYRATDGGDNGVDIVFLSSVHDFPRWRDESRLMPYKVIPFDDIYPQFLDPDGAYTGLYMHTFGSIIYNSNFTDKSTLPTTYLDFLQPEWVDRLILTYPNDNDGILYLFTLIAKKYGFELIESLIKTQKARWVRGIAAPLAMIGKVDMNNTQNARSVSFASFVDGVPNISVVEPEDMRVAYPKMGAIFATAKAPESAKLFMNFILSDARQALVSQGKFSVRKTYDDAGIFSQKYMDPLGYGKFMADRAEVERWRLQFESLLGPPQGPDPVKVW